MLQPVWSIVSTCARSAPPLIGRIAIGGWNQRHEPFVRGIFLLSILITQGIASRERGRRRAVSWIPLEQIQSPLVVGRLVPVRCERRMPFGGRLAVFKHVIRW
jgi:hypothetical protein